MYIGLGMEVNSGELNEFKESPGFFKVGRIPLSVNYINYIGDVNYGSAAYAYLWDRRTQVLHAGVTYVNYGSFDGYDEQGNPLCENCHKAKKVQKNGLKQE